MPCRRPVRVEFTKKHDTFLYQYLAKYCPKKEGRSGRKIFQDLVANEAGSWPWSVHHTWQSWRERYVKNAVHFDARILRYQEKEKEMLPNKQKRPADSMAVDAPTPPAKRAKLQAEGPSDSEARAERDVDAQRAGSNSPRSTSISDGARESRATSPQAQPLREPGPADVGTPSTPHPATSTNTDATGGPSSGLPAAEAECGAIEILSSPNQPPPTTDVEVGSRSSSPVVEGLEERPRDVSVSEPSSPSKIFPVDDTGNISDADTVYPRAPPRLVNSFHGQVLTDQEGRVPRAFPRAEANRTEEKEKNEARSLSRGLIAKQTTADGPDVEIRTHHPFSQVQTKVGEREREKSQHPSRKRDGAQSDRRTVTAELSAEQHRDAAPRVEGERQENGASPVKRIVSGAPAPLSNGSKSTKFPAPRASTRSPFRPEPSIEEGRRPNSETRAARHPALIRIRQQTIGHEREDANENGHEHERGRKREPRRNRDQVPSIDLVALSHSSTSARSHSHSSGGASAPARPPRWSLPAYAHAMPWVVDGPAGVPSAPGSALVSRSGSGSPFRWAAPFPAHSDVLGHPRASSLRSFGETSTPWFAFTPSPGHSVAAVASGVSAPQSHAGPLPLPISASPSLSTSLSISPHPSDLSLAAAHGLASILAHMSANHGLALSVVEAVYARVGSLREADEVLKGMREAAEGFGEREIKRRGRGKERWRTRREWAGRGRGRGEKSKGERGRGGKVREKLRYMIASEDGEGSEYSPPETSRAAMWKQQSESESHAEEGDKGDSGEGEERVEGGEGEDDEEEEGRAVEVELLEREPGHEDEDEAVAEAEVEHELSDELFLQAALDNMKAYELEKKMGRVQFHKHIVKQFV